MHPTDMSNYEWRITIGIQRHWVTTEEKDTYLNSIAKGMDLVPLRDGRLLLGKNAQEIIHCSTLDQSQQIEDYRKEGKYQCNIGNWHTAGSPCYCNVEMIETDEGTILIQEKTPTSLPEPRKEEMKVQPVSQNLGRSIKSF